MKHLVAILAFTALTASAQTSGQWGLQQKNAGAGFTTHWATAGNNYLFATDGSGVWTPIPKSTFEPALTIGTGITRSGSTLSVNMSALTPPWSGISGKPDFDATYQPLDSDLTAIAGVSTQSYGRDLLNLPSDGAARARLGLGSLATLNSTTVTTGGTGQNSLTAYAPLFGGTTSTGAVQSGTVGTAGQVLTSNGAGALPTFQAPAAQSIPARFGSNYQQVLRRVRTAMEMGVESLSIQVIGDSMGDAQGSTTTTGEWVSQVAYRLAALYPAYNVVHKVYDQPNARYNSYAVQTGSSGERYLNFPAGNLYSQKIPVEDIITPTSGDVDIRVKIVVPSWAAYATANAGAAKVMCCEYNAGGADSRFTFLLHESKVPVITWNSSTSGYNSTFASASFTNADNTPIWIRVTIEGNSGGSNVVKFYTSSDAINWTQLGATRTNPSYTGAQPVVAVARELEIGGRAGGSEPMRAARIYAVEVLDGVNGPPHHPLNIDAALWRGFGTIGTTAPQIVGSPTLVINNASVYAYDIASLLALSNKPWLRHDGRGCTILAQGYNNIENPTAFKAQLDAVLTAVRTRRPLDNILAIVEPFSSANTATLHYYGDIQKRGVIMDWAPRNDAGLLDMHGIFVNDGRSLFSDNIHPDGNGTALWATSFMTAWSE